jgi:hypothetical protein
MKSIIAPPKLRILIALFAILSLNKFTEGKVRLVPKGKKNQKKQQLRKNRQSKPNGKPNGKPKGNGKAAQVILKPRRKEAANIQLQATIGKNEKGEQVLLLSEESAAAVTTAMQTSQVAQEKQQEAEPVKQTAAVKVPLEKEEEPEEQQVLFYDPAELKTAAGEIPLPKHVFDEEGNEVDMAGKEAILIPPPNNDHPPPPPPQKEEVSSFPFLPKFQY